MKWDEMKRHEMKWNEWMTYYEGNAWNGHDGMNEIHEWMNINKWML